MSLPLAAIKANAIKAVKRDGYDRIIYRSEGDYVFSKINDNCLWEGKAEYLVKLYWLGDRISEVRVSEISN